MTLHHSTLQRLSFAKYLYTLAIEQSRLPEIQAAASVLTLHDSIEFFLQIASEHLNAGKGQPSFLDYWDILSPKLAGADLPQKESMRRLNKARVSLKHSGTLPSRLDIESFRASVTEFFTEASPLVFGLEFSELSLIEYVSNDEVKLHLKKAVDLATRKAYEESTQEVALAYEKLIDAYTFEVASSFPRHAFSFGPSMTFMSASHIGLRGDRSDRLGKFVDATKRSIEELQNAVRILSLGINYKKYLRFRSRLPVAMRMASGSYVTQTYVSQTIARKEIDHEYIQFCIMFVVECAIRLDESSAVATDG